jgi:drug/metabolite transporter (DMT)-like permease
VNPYYYGLLLVTSLLWAGNFVAGKLVVGHASAVMLTDLRYGGSVLMLLPFVWMKERRLLPPLSALLPLAGMGLTGVVIYNVMMFDALKTSDPATLGLITSLNPIALAVLSFLFLREKMNGRQLAGMAISLFGVLAVISHGRFRELTGLRFNPGDLEMLAAVFSWGLYSIIGRNVMKRVSPLMATLWSGIFGTAFLIPFNLGSFEVRDTGAGFWVSAVYMSVGGTVLAMLFWNIGVQKLGGARSAVFLNFNPIFTAILACLLLGDRLSGVQVWGSLVVIGGVVLFTVPFLSRPSFRFRLHFDKMKQ